MASTDSSSDDEGFMTAFATKRGSKAAAVRGTADAGRSPAAAAAAPAVVLARPARKVASEQRRADLAHSVASANRNFARQLALGGLAAKRQAEEHAARDDEAQRVKEMARRHEAAEGATEGGKPLTTLEECYAAASAIEKDAANVDAGKALHAWQRVFAVASLELRTAGKDAPARRDHALRAQMTSLARQARVYDKRGETRKAFNALEELCRLSGLLSKRDVATLQALVPMLHKAAALRSSVGSSEKAADLVLQAAAIEAALRKRTGGGGGAGAAAGAPPATAVAAAGEALTCGATTADADKEQQAAAEPKPEPSTAQSAPERPVQSPSHSATPASTEAPSLVAAATATTSSTSSLSTAEHDEGVAPSPLPSIEDLRALVKLSPTVVFAVSGGGATTATPASDDECAALFSRAIAAAMFEKDFSFIRALLNRSLLGDANARTALLARAVPRLGVTPCMVAAASNEGDIVRRLLGVAGGREAVLAQAVSLRDSAGNNAVMHAAACDARAALDELLKALVTAGSVPLTPVDGTPLFSPLGYSLDGLPSSYTPAVASQLAAFAYDPKRYAVEYSDLLARQAKERASNAAQPANAAAYLSAQPPLPAQQPPLPTSPPPAAAAFQGQARPSGPWPTGQLLYQQPPLPSVIPPSPLPGQQHGNLVPPPNPPPLIAAAPFTSIQEAAAAFATRQMMFVMATAAGIPPALALAMTGVSPPLPRPSSAAVAASRPAIMMAAQPPLPPTPAPAAAVAALAAVPAPTPPADTKAAAKKHVKVEVRKPGSSGGSAAPSKTVVRIPPPTLPAAEPPSAAAVVITAAAASSAQSQPASRRAAASAGAAAAAPAHVAANVSLEARDGKLVGRELQRMELSSSSSGVVPEGDAGAAVGGLEDELLEGGGDEEGDAAFTAAPSKGGKRKGKGKKGGGASASSASASTAGWDQFAANEALFGVRADSFREELYTSKLDVKKFTQEQITAAEALAEEIINAQDEYSSNPHVREERGKSSAMAGAEEEGEEERFSAVARAPPAASSGAAGAAAAGKGSDSFTDAGVAKRMAKK